MSTRFVAMGDSFTEGIGDEHADYPNGVRGWADRVAEQLAEADPAFGYANLAIRGRLLPRVLREQLEPALRLEPDLVTLYAGANDLMRPRVDIDELARRYDDAVAALAATGATIILFTGVDAGAAPLFRHMRGRTAVYNEHVRDIAARHDTHVVDMWSMRSLADPRMLSPDRIHLNTDGHRTVAAAVLDTLAVAHSVSTPEFGPRQTPSPAVRRRANLLWAREHAAPWVKRRLCGQSSGDAVTAKRPTLAPLVTTAR